jgi:hypothetical protein
VPEDRLIRKQYGGGELKRLIDRFGTDLPSVENAEAEWGLLREKLLVEFETCRGAAEVCQRMIRSVAYTPIFPNLTCLARIALTIPLSTAWPERGFSAMKRVKTRQRSRLLDSTLCALLNISMNGPEQLTDEEGLMIARLWKDNKKRRRVFDRPEPAAAAADVDESAEEGASEANDFEINDEFENMDSFWL